MPPSALPRPWLGTTADNPTVGALVVDPTTQVLLARAVTAKGGRPHAESQALDQAGHDASGMTLYVTLEPCHHWGRTPPCVDAVIRSGIMRVVIGMSDPDPRTSGESLKRLAAAGIEVVVADHEPSRRLHDGHAMRQRAGRPFVTAQARRFRRRHDRPSRRGQCRHHRRCRPPTGPTCSAPSPMPSWSVAAPPSLDDPQLTVRLQGLEKRTPLRVVLAGAEGIDRKVNLIGGFSGHRVAIIATIRVAHRRAGLRRSHPRRRRKTAVPILLEALKTLAAKGIQDVCSSKPEQGSPKPARRRPGRPLPTADQ